MQSICLKTSQESGGFPFASNPVKNGLHLKIKCYKLSTDQMYESSKFALPRVLLSHVFSVHVYIEIWEKW